MARGTILTETSCCHCEEAVFADEAIPKSRVGDCFAPLAMTVDKFLSSDEAISAVAYIEGGRLLRCTHNDIRG